MKLFQKQMWWVAGVVVMGVGACAPMITPPQDIPSEIQYVLDNPTVFAQSADDPMVDTAPGTVVDEMSTLDGCWGATGVFTQEGNNPEVTNSEAYHFDSAAGTINWQIYQTISAPVVGAVSALLNPVGTYVVNAGGTGITITYTLLRGSDLQTGVIHDAPYNVDTMGTILTSGSEVLVTVDGDKMKIANGTLKDKFESQRAELIFVRFDCPTAVNP